MARCGCTSDCSCSVRSGGCVRVVGNGSPGSPYVISLIVDPDEGNILSCGAAGLKAVLPQPSVYVEATDCIDIEGDGTPVDPLRASPRLDPAAENVLSCGVEGLKASVVGKPVYDVRTITESADVDFGWLVLADTTDGSLTVTLPALVPVGGTVVVVKKIAAANTVTITGDGGETIDGASTSTLTSLWSSVTLVSTGSMWVRTASI